ncbi:hypothetical protein F0P96_18155 [Hymenobacter busanensis]|uniref:Uncharacterized protein n=1 Tax=Hymenobacter busanensis TaxID=2607656 RepID=A0A7L4ZST8_9BACT|nr:hypothetical protein [Hymenobacter busanensis]KAA9327160.1 hypothetical protein F0P96_18155 [Hymenobacter busanensis]QHJ05826.1 hypothetical protein GUY19_00355 [Hymenobacter busanensis]
MQLIKRATVLAEIDQYERDGRLHVFSLGYYKTDGTKGSKARVRKGGHVVPGGVRAGASKFGYQVKHKGVLQLVNDTTGQPFAVKIKLLTHYNGIRILH